MPTSRPQLRGTFVLVITVSPIFLSISYYRRRTSFAGLAARLGHHFLCFGKLVMGRNQPGFPLQVGALDRQARRVALEEAARFGDVDEVGERGRNDRETTLPFRLDQPVGCEPRQRLAQRV